MLVAHHFASRVLSPYASKFSRHDFTLPQLFACLVLREHQRKSYRGIEALLRDCQHWCKAIGMKKAPDHNTLCRAFHVIVNQRNADKLLNQLSQWMAITKQLGDTVAIDSTLMDVHHRSRHYEQRCRHYATNNKREADTRRSDAAKRTPKLTIGIDTRCHFILAARPRTGMASDSPDFAPILRHSKRRNKRLRYALADAGYDAHENHYLARRTLHVRSLIPASVGRPTSRPPSSPFRKQMTRELNGSQKGKRYGQRAQVETVNSMMKRNLGDSLRAHSCQARNHEQVLRVITHNVMIIRHKKRIETKPLRPRFSPGRRVS